MLRRVLIACQTAEKKAGRGEPDDALGDLNNWAKRQPPTKKWQGKGTSNHPPAMIFERHNERILRGHECSIPNRIYHILTKRE